MRRRVLVLGAVALAGLIGVVMVPFAMLATMTAGGSKSTAVTGTGAVSACTLEDSDVTAADLDDEQIANARTLIAVGKTLQIPARGWVVAISTALQESGLRNLDYGDRDSLGLMQQRPSAGWGAPSQVTNPAYAARAFYGGRKSPTSNSGLLSIEGWQGMPVWEAAQTVQRSAFPFAYAQHEPLATDLVKKLAGKTAGCQELAAGPWQPPVQAGYTLTSEFGPRISPTLGVVDFHTGQDIAAPTGTPALATSQGTVAFVGVDGGYGNLVRVRHANGVETYYAHLSAFNVQVGDQVNKGDPLGAVGSTGNSTGPHLHLEVRVDDKPTDPVPWLRGKGAGL